jgi:hypothetical protein
MSGQPRKAGFEGDLTRRFLCSSVDLFRQRGAAKLAAHVRDAGLERTVAVAADLRRRFKLADEVRPACFRLAVPAGCRDASIGCGAKDGKEEAGIRGMRGQRVLRGFVPGQRLEEDAAQLATGTNDDFGAAQRTHRPKSSG